MAVRKVGPDSKERRPGESAAEYLARVLTPAERAEVLARFEALAAKRKYGPKGIGSVAIKHILDKREARYNREATLTRKRRAEKKRKRNRRGLHGERLDTGQRNVGRDANGLPIYANDE